MTKETNKQPSKRRPREKPAFTEREQDFVDALDRLANSVRRLKRTYISMHVYPFGNPYDCEPAVTEIIFQHRARKVSELLEAMEELQYNTIEDLKDILLDASAVPSDFDNIVSAILPGDAFEDDQFDEEDDFDPV